MSGAADRDPAPQGDPEPFADQRARTSLAWTRSMLGCVVVAALSARAGWRSSTPALLVALPLGIAAGALALGIVRTSALRRPAETDGRRDVVWMAIAVTGLAATGLLAVLAGAAARTG